MCELGEFAKMQFNLIRISCEFHACSEISFKSIWSRYRSDRTEFQARASIRSGDPLWRPELFQPKKPFMRVLMTQEQLKCMPIYYPFLCVHSFCLVSDLRPGMEYHAAKATRWICRTGSSSFIFCRRLASSDEFSYSLALAHSFIHHAGNSKRCFRTVKADTT